ncbi:MAG TPA: GNAT family N-acetyltransferase [Candidatus Eisenbacteria bacterium]|nr:GNAT family N-acetyltransferase [Candidatus Eisenbacteria bacterium]
MPASDAGRYVLTTGVPAERFEDLMALLRSAWWSNARTSEDVRRLIAGPSLFFFACERASGRLVAMARALSDGVYKAMVFDVIVLPEHQGQGLGCLVMEELLGHPAVRAAQHVELYCLPELEPFYERWGFTAEIGGVRLIRRTQGPKSPA